jgi:SAM-dependent methyltransferase
MKQLDLISDDKWFEMLLKSIKNRTVDGVEFPGFPTEALQAQFVGSSNESALLEGFEFYRLVKGYSAALGKPFDNATKFLDFGCGWGRYLRIFKKDIAEKNLFGVDIDPTILDECRINQVPGELSRIFPDGKLPYPDSFFDCVIAYSVFTHLPEDIHNHWIQEITRVSKPGCVFVLTLESIRFLDFVEDLGRTEPTTNWHRGLSQFAGNVPAYRDAYSKGEFVYLPTGGGDFRSADVYGDAVVSRNYVEHSWGGLFNIIDYIDEPARFWQAVLIAQRP